MRSVNSNQEDTPTNPPPSETAAVSLSWYDSKRFRKWRRKKIKRTGKFIIRGVRDFLGSQSTVSIAPFNDPEDFPFTEDLKANWEKVHEEVLGILEFKEAVPGFEDVSADQKRIAKDRQWRTFILYGFGEPSKKNCTKAPFTAELLARVPNIQTAMLSIIEPGYHIPPHKGVTKGILTCHLGLIVPQEHEKCWIRVGDQTGSWKQGEIIVFDDTYEHEVLNDTPELRVVLFVQFTRPMRLWGRVLNRAFLSILKFTAYYKEPKKNIADFEDQFEAAVRRAGEMVEDMKV